MRTYKLETPFRLNDKQLKKIKQIMARDGSPTSGNQKNTTMVGGLHNGVWGDFERSIGNASNISGDASNITGHIGSIRGDVSSITGNVSHIRGDVSRLSGDVSGLIGDVTGISGDATGIRIYLDDFPKKPLGINIRNVWQLQATGME